MPNPITRRLIMKMDIESYDIMSDGTFHPKGVITKSVALRDAVLVDPTAYFKPEDDEWSEVPTATQSWPLRGVWATVTGFAGGASVHPVKVTFDRAEGLFQATGQYKASELLSIINNDRQGAEHDPS